MSINRGTRAAMLLFMFGLPLGGAGLISLLPQEEHHFQTIETDGVSVAVTTGGPRYAGDLFTYEEVLTIPQERVRKRALLSDPTVFTMDEDGFFYVVDAGNHRLVVFDPEGEFVRDFGEEGEEPGQFMTPILQSVEEGVVTIYDMQIDRVTRFTTDGALIDTIGVPMFHFPFTPIPKKPTVSDYYRAQDEAEEFERTHLMQPVGLYERPGGGWIVPEVSFRPRGDALTRTIIYDADLDTVAVMDSDPVRSGTTVVIRAGGRSSGPGSGSPGLRSGMQSGTPSPAGAVMARERHRLPFAPFPAARYVPGRGIVLTTGEEPVLEWYDLEGNLTGRVTIETPPVPVTAEDEQLFEKGYGNTLLATEQDDGRTRRAGRNLNQSPRNRREMMEMMEAVSARGRLESMKRYMTLPKTKAFWDHLFVDDSGCTWLRVPENYNWGPEAVQHRYWIVSPEGEFLGSTQTPPTFPTRNFQEQFRAVPLEHGHFMSVKRDEATGAWRLTVYRVTSAIPGFSYP
ncbi:6-bladed beta-propeller [Gemmatimonadota bacterium]